MPIQITVMYSPAPRVVHSCVLDMPVGATAREALAAIAKQSADFAHLPSGAVLGVWGRRVQGHQVLSDHDRLEIYRALQIDPKMARRERFKKQGAKSAGLFAKRRPGAKPGY
jgi:uncharacterized protein